MGGVIGTGGDDAEASRIEQFASNQAGKPGFAPTGTVGPAKGAQAGLSGVAAVDGTQGVIVLRESH